MQENETTNEEEKSFDINDLPQNNPKDTKQVYRMFTLVLQIGITMLTTVFLCICLGALLEHFLNIHVMIWFIILGVVSGFRAVAILIHKFTGIGRK